MQTVILAAGEGTRMRPLTITKPKVLIEVSGKPFLYFVLKNVQKAGIRDIIIVAGYKKEMIESFLRMYNLKATVVEQKERLGTGHAVSLVENLVHDDFILLYGDNLYSSEDIRSLIVHDQFSYVSSFDHPHPEKYGVVVEQNGFLEKIVEKPKEHMGNNINVGLYKCTPEIFEALKHVKKSARGEYELTDALTYLAKQQKVKVHKIKDHWIDFGGLEDIPVADQKIQDLMEELQLDYYFDDLAACPLVGLFSGIRYPWEALKKKDAALPCSGQEILGTVHKSAIIEGPVKIGKGTVIEPFVFIEGPVIIGEDCHIRSFARIRPKTIIGNRCLVGNSVEVKNSLLFDEAKTSSHSFVGDSILGKGARLGSGVIIGNRRFDQKPITFYINDQPFSTDMEKVGAVIGDYARLGANCSTTPGALIGKHSWIYANVLVRSFVPKNSLVKLRQATEIINKDVVLLNHKDSEGKI